MLSAAAVQGSVDDRIAILNDESEGSEDDEGEEEELDDDILYEGEEHMEEVPPPTQPTTLETTALAGLSALGEFRSLRQTHLPRRA